MSEQRSGALYGFIILSAIILAVPSGFAYAQDVACPSAGSRPVMCPIPGYPTIACPVVTDEIVRANVASRLAAATGPEVPLCVQVIEGMVTLTGSVPDQGSKELATILAFTVRGVRGVNNLLVLSGTSNIDMELVGAVVKELSRQAFDVSRIRVFAKNGVVELKGVVRSEFAFTQAELVAESVRGVKAVYNNLIIDYPESNLF